MCLDERRIRRRALIAATGVWILTAPAAPLRAQSLAGASPAASFRVSFKNSVLVARSPDDVALFPNRQAAVGFWRVRFTPTFRLGEAVLIDAAYEQRLRVFSTGSRSIGAAVIPGDVDAPYRVRQLDWSIATDAHSVWRHEIDRAALRVRLKGGEIIVGRQAVGWGRGVFFSAIDLFSPFTPLEADREWRRGIDAVRADVPVTDCVSVDAVAAFGGRVDDSAFGVRLRGNAGHADWEAVGGRRARDEFAGGATSVALAGVEVHGEAALFRTRAASDSAAFASPRTIAKAVAGGSYRLAVGSGLLLQGEYHYSGFGAPAAADLVRQLADPEFRRRYLRGDTQILARHDLAAALMYEISPLISLAGQWLQNPVDGSGVAVASATLVPSDRWSMSVTAYAPYGRTPEGMSPRSEYGLTPAALFAQLRFYR